MHGTFDNDVMSCVKQKLPKQIMLIRTHLNCQFFVTYLGQAIGIADTLPPRRYLRYAA